MSESESTRQITTFLSALEGALAKGDVTAAAALFGEECFWRDLIAFTWNITTQEGQGAIAAMLAETLPRVRPHNWRIEGAANSASGVTDAWFTFETAVARGRGHVRLKDGRAWTLLTAMMELKGFEEKAGERREKGAQHGVHRDRVTWLEQREQEAASLGITEQPYVLIVGGGQGGIGLGARLRRQGVPTLIIDANARPGDAWRKRYRSLCLHDPVWYDHLPYMPFPDHWPVYMPKDKLADWLEMYVKVMELAYWGSTTCQSAAYDPASGTWTVRVLRDGAEIVLRPAQLVLATGMSGVPSLPDMPGAEMFAGEQHHSSHHPGGEAYAGKKCVIVGSNNSAHDIAADLWENAAAEVTMIQRSSTLVARAETLLKMTTGKLYSEEALKAGIDTDKADLTAASMPYALMPRLQTPLWQQIAELDKPFYDRLREAGFLLDFGEDGSGLSLKYLRRGSGYYIEVGASELVANGQIKLRSGVQPARLTQSGLVLSDGSELEADLIIYATGYGSMTGWAAALISEEVADRVGPCWGLGSGTAKDPGPWEGELRNMWKPTRQPGLWFHGGNLAQSRHYSRYMALQMKARLEGIATPVYGSEPVLAEA